MLENNYRKIEKKKDDDMDADVAQCEHNNIKRYTSAFSNIQIWIAVRAMAKLEFNIGNILMS